MVLSVNVVTGSSILAARLWFVKTALARAATEWRFAKHRHDAIRYSTAPRRTYVWGATTGTGQFRWLASGRGHFFERRVKLLRVNHAVSTFAHPRASLIDLE
jgi:hypothetical protein